MLEIRITIDAPELAKAINNLFSAMSGAKAIEPVSKNVEQVDTPVQESTASRYTREQIMQAGAALMDACKISELTNLLQSFGVQAVMQLKPEQLDSFAAAMRDFGAKI